MIFCLHERVKEKSLFGFKGNLKKSLKEIKSEPDVIKKIFAKERNLFEKSRASENLKEKIENTKQVLLIVIHKSKRTR